MTPVKWKQHHAWLRRNRYATWRESGRADLIARLEAVRQRLTETDALLTRCKPYTPYVPMADGVPF